MEKEIGGVPLSMINLIAHDRSSRDAARPVEDDGASEADRDEFSGSEDGDTAHDLDHALTLNTADDIAGNLEGLSNMFHDGDSRLVSNIMAQSTTDDRHDYGNHDSNMGVGVTSCGDDSGNTGSGGGVVF